MNDFFDSLLDKALSLNAHLETPSEATVRYLKKTRGVR